MHTFSHLSLSPFLNIFNWPLPVVWQMSTTNHQMSPFCPLSGRYPQGDIGSQTLDAYSQQYDQSFQTVPTSIPPTPSPEWPELVSQHSNAHNPNSLLAPPPQHIAHLSGHHHHHLQQNYGPPMHGREHGSLDQIGLIRANGHQTGPLYHPPSIDGKPVIQAAQLAGKLTNLYSLSSFLRI